MKAKILIVEDDIYLREGLDEILTNEEYETFCACNLSQGKILFESNAPDLIILDVMLPDGNGLDLCNFIRKSDAETQILFLTACDEEFQIVRGLDAGADDYITKPFRLLELLSRIRALLRRKTSAQLYHYDDIYIDVSNMTVKKGEKNLFLTPTEFQILCTLIKNNGVIVSRKALFEKIWDYDDSYIDDNTLSVHVSRLREKIGSQHIKTVRGIGYRWED